ncbi:AraC family transcriptional regulator [Patulibacter defluvii]|uniref:AraC family transcriptional regulator n=1 Tax=Patulibacter defluvii TaxID=3095358 RepID=UPI002A74B13A|nr:AraC family transcriptional regulator [Patulibacter sp. DM4]
MSSPAPDRWWDFPRGPNGVRVLVAVGVDRGLRVADCLAGSGIAPATLDDPDGWIAAGQELQVARNLVARLGDVPGIGVDAGRRYTLASMGIWGFAVLTSPTWGAAIDVGLRYVQLTFAFVRPRLQDDGRQVRLVIDDDHVPADVRDLLAERDLTSAAIVMQAIAGGVPPLTVTTRLPPERASLVAAAIPEVRLLGGREQTAITVERSLLETPLPQADELTWRATQRACAELVARRRERAGIAGAVRSRLLARPDRMPGLAEVAGELHVSPRTLVRRLAADGTSFSSLRDEVREALAAELLRGTALTVGEVAARLGYVDATSFTHAFTRWTGQPPGRFRADAAA